MDGRTFVMGDIHGNHKALIQVLKKANFDYKEDTLIQLGDVVDGYPEVVKCVDELLGIEKLIAIRGNHDQWFLDFIETGIHGSYWQQGAQHTKESYLFYIGRLNMLEPEDIPLSHQEFFKNQVPYYFDKERNIVFVHGGFNRHLDFFTQSEKTLMWDRDLWYSALSFAAMQRGSVGDEYHKFKNYNDFNTIYIGHTTTMSWGETRPMKAANVINMDTGAGFKGRLSMMNIDTLEVFSSDMATEFYPDFKPR